MARSHATAPAPSTELNGHVPASGNVWGLMAEALKSHLDTSVDRETVEQIVEDRLAARAPKVIEVRTDRAVTTIEGVHHQFEDVLGLVEEGFQNILLVGPAGTGKTTLAKHLAKSLAVDFGFLSLSAGVTETHLLGRVLPQEDGSWKYTSSRFVEVYENGGVFLLDEIDAADPNVMVSVNAALANGILANPVSGRIHHRHADTIIVAAANTWGTGGDAQYVGRNALDAATLDRFVLATLLVEYDRDLEDRLLRELPPELSSGVRAWIDGLRHDIAAKRLRRLASTRLVVGCIKALAAGRPFDAVKARFFQSWSADERGKVGA